MQKESRYRAAVAWQSQRGKHLRHILILAIAFTMLVSINTGCESQQDSELEIQEEETSTSVLPPEPTPVSESLPEIELFIKKVFAFGDANAEVGCNEDYNIYVNFTPELESGRIYFEQSNKSVCEWLGLYARETENTLFMYQVNDTVTGKELYLIQFFFAGAPYSVNDLYLFDAESEKLIQEIANADVFETKAKFIKNRDEGYHIYIPEYGIDQQMEFGGFVGDWMKALYESEGLDRFTMDISLFIRGINRVFVTDTEVALERVVFKCNEEEFDYGSNEIWLPDFWFKTTYIIKNGVFTPVNYEIIDI